jgi:hypothetical protein
MPPIAACPRPRRYRLGDQGPGQSRMPLGPRYLAPMIGSTGARCSRARSARPRVPIDLPADPIPIPRRHSSLQRLTRIDFVGDSAVADNGHADGLLPVGQLIEDPISAYPQGIQPAQLASERVSGLRFALQRPQCVLDRVDQRPVKFEQLPPHATGKNEPCQRSAGDSPALGKLAAKLREGDRFAALYLGEASLQSGESVGVGENLGGLL